MFPLALAAFSALIGLILSTSILKWRRQRIKLPPGPPRKPLFGNLGDLPSNDVRLWEFWLKHKETYGKFSDRAIMSHENIVVTI